MAEDTEAKAEEVHSRAVEFSETFCGIEFFEEGFAKLSYKLFSLAEVMYGSETAEKALDLRPAFSSSWR